MAKVIKDFKINLGSVPTIGAKRSFTVDGDNGAIFSIQVKSPLGTFYDFNTSTFTATASGLRNKKITSGSFSGSILFPAMASDTTPKQYEVFLFAETEYDTVHANYSEVTFEDGSIDVNSSSGSNSNLLHKVVYQPVDVAVTLTAIDLYSTLYSLGDFTGATATTQVFTIGRGSGVVKNRFSLTVTADGESAFQILRQPIASDLLIIDDIKFSDYIRVPNEELWDGAVRSTGNVVNGDFSGGATNITMNADVGLLWKIGDRVTGNAALNAKTGDFAVTVTAVSVGGNDKIFTMSESIAIADDETLVFRPPFYRRFRVHDDSSGHLLRNGSSVLDLTSTDIPSTSGVVRGYSETIEYTTNTQSEDGSVTEVINNTTTFLVPGFDKEGRLPTIVDGNITKQLGVVTFDKKVKADMALGVVKKLVTRGADSLKTTKNITVALTDLEAVLTAPTTTTTAEVVDSSTIPVADREGTVANVSTISGIGIDPTVVDPVVTSSSADGAGNWTVSSALPQSIEKGAVLTVGGTSRILTITGTIEFSNVEINAATQILYFDLAKFIKAF